MVKPFFPSHGLAAWAARPVAVPRAITDVAAYTREHLPKWNPMNVCSYHLQEAGATPELHIPETLQDSLMARLDALGPVKQLAQLGAASRPDRNSPLPWTLAR